MKRCRAVLHTGADILPSGKPWHVFPCSGRGSDGFRILQRQLASTGRAELMKIKRRAFLSGVDLLGYPSLRGFHPPDAGKRRSDIEHATAFLQQAYQLAM